MKYLHFFLSALLVCCCLTVSANEKEDQEAYNTPREYLPYSNFTNPYKRFFSEPLNYHGYGRNIPEPTDVETVKIGFLGPIEPTVSIATGGNDVPLGQEMLKGARLAIEHANANNGYRGSGIPYELIVHNDNGLWGASGDEIIDMAYKKKVWAILGTIDGANSHIAIRVALKAEIPMMNSCDTDPTFIETNIPWVFRCITDDRQMCYLMADFIFKHLKLDRVAALRANNRYARIGIDEFRDAARRLEHPLITELNYQPGDTDFTSQLQLIQKLNPDCVVTYGNALESALILKQMRAMGMQQWFVGGERMISEEFLKHAGDNMEKVAAVSPYNPNSQDDVHIEFIKEFEAEYQSRPSTYATHTYDGMNILIQAIEKAGLNRALIRDELAQIKTYHGASGVKSFNAIFNNVSAPYLGILNGDSFEFYSKEKVLSNAF